MKEENPAVDRECLLKKWPGKGGWTYAEIPEIPQDRKAPFGWVSVKGWIDDFELKRFKLMPMGNGQLFLSVRKEIRKKIGKEAGDTVKLVLWPDLSHLEIPQEIMDCFELEPKKTYENFMKLTEGDRKLYLDWIYDAKKEETKVERIARMMDKVFKGKRFWDKDE
ncbi:MAG: YdeI/OmpD-associated family protein [Bacteroidota bacterium]